MSNWTDVVVIGALVSLLGWETWTLVNREKNDTISESVWRSLKSRFGPLIALLSGLLLGHWFWCPCALE